MKKIYLLLFWVTVASIGRSQNIVVADNTVVKRCATVEVMAEARKKNPNAETDAQFESWMNNMIQQRRNTQLNPLAKLTVVNYNLPVIFHIVSNGEAVGTLNNTSAALITQQLLQVNKDFANQSGSPYAVASTTGLQFFLAQRNRAGATLAEPGIDRISRSSFPSWTDPTAGWTIEYITNTVKPATIWDPSRYLNIWVVPSIPGTVAGTEVLGFATFPASSGLDGVSDGETNMVAGVVIKTTTVGSIFQPSTCTYAHGKGKTLSHELGHFFGLRHIWGDANCGTDFVNDTPVHKAANDEVPTHPKPNDCGTPDEMFENYMDYTDDIVLNTFTVNQVDRMQTIMTRSPRRASLATSNVGFVPVTGTNRISFNECSGAISYAEGGTTGTYPRYRDVNLYLNAEDKATGPATVSLNVAGSAVSGTQFTLLTPSVLTFATGDNVKPVSIRLLDNAAVDGNRTITLTYTIAGTGVTAGASAQSLTITILDDDNFPTTQNAITLINESFDATGNIPTGWATPSFSTSPANVWTVSANGNAGGSGNCAHITNNTATRPNTYTKTVASTTGIRTPLISPIPGMQNITVSFNYRVWGEVSGSTPVDYGRVFYTTPALGSTYTSVTATGANLFAGTTDSVTAVANFTLPASFNSIDFNLAMLWFNNGSGGNNPPMNIDNFIVKGDGVPVETAVSSSYGYDVAAGTTNNFRSSNNKSIARLSAVNAALTNVAVAVTESGTDRPNFTANGRTYLRTRKVISVNPSPANTTAQYTLKLYYTAEELAVWGGNIANLKIMKVNTGINLLSPLNNSNATIITPSLVEDSIASRGYAAFTATFTGFSQFVLVEANAVLPVRWLSFTGVLKGNSIKLAWKTADEVNNKGFEIERSTDAVAFEKIDWVGASASKSYELFDSKIVKGNTYYYRLKQIDKDGNYSYSPVVRVTYAGNNMVTVFPNPVKNNLVIQQSGTGRTSVVITDLTGKTVYSTTFTAGSLTINAQPWSKGLYLVRVIKNEEVNTYKISKQ